MPTRSDVVAAARGYLGTPYHHQGASRGAGCDCLGLVRGVWRDLYGTDPEAVPPYTPDWGEVGHDEPLLDGARRHMQPVRLGEAREGDVIVFRVQPQAVAKHVAILTTPFAAVPTRMIHALSRDQVRDVAVTDGWRRRAVASFRFPRLEP